MYRIKPSVSRLWDYLKFQVSIDGLGTYPLQIRRKYCVMIFICQLRLNVSILLKSKA
jgi:hypothetical protein